MPCFFAKYMKIIKKIKYPIKYCTCGNTKLILSNDLCAYCGGVIKKNKLKNFDKFSN